MENQQSEKGGTHLTLNTSRMLKLLYGNIKLGG